MAMHPLSWTLVQSSNLRAVRYDTTARQLDVWFLSGRIYRYFDVPAETYAALIAAPSHGQFFSRSIRGRYRYERLTGEEVPEVLISEEG
jgi:hypothetical protein